MRCAGKMGLKMRHDALKVLLSRAFKQSGFEVRMEQNGGLLDKRRPADVEVKDWVDINNWNENTSLSIDIAIIDSTGDSHSAILKRDGVGAAATRYENRKRKKYRDVKGVFSPFIIEAHGGFGKEAKKIVRELERRRKDRQCIPNVRHSESFIPLGEINLVTAIGFELVRRNVRMILDRSPEEEPLIPSERTKIRLEVLQSKRRVKNSNKGEADDDRSDGSWNTEAPFGRSKPSHTNREAQNLGEIVRAKSQNMISTETRDMLDDGISLKQNADIRSMPHEDKDNRAKKKGKFVTAVDGSKGHSSLESPEPSEDPVNKDTGSNMFNVADPENNQKSEEIPRIDGSPQEAHGMNTECSSVQDTQLAARMCEGDAIRSKINRSAPDSSTGLPSGDIPARRKEFYRRTGKYYTSSQELKTESSTIASVIEIRERNLEEPDDSRSVFKTNKKLKPSNSNIGNKMLEITPQANVNFTGDMKGPSLRHSALGTITTRLSPRQASEYSERVDLAPSNVSSVVQKEKVLSPSLNFPLSPPGTKPQY